MCIKAEAYALLDILNIDIAATELFNIYCLLSGSIVIQNIIVSVLIFPTFL